MTQRSSTAVEPRITVTLTQVEWAFVASTCAAVAKRMMDRPERFEWWSRLHGWLLDHMKRRPDTDPLPISLAESTHASIGGQLAGIGTGADLYAWVNNSRREAVAEAVPAETAKAAAELRRRIAAGEIELD